MTRFQALIAAAGLTALVLVGLVWWGQGAADAADAAVGVASGLGGTTVTLPAATVLPGVQPAEAATAGDIQRLVEENRQLRQTVEVLMAREGEYQRQIEAANQRLQAASAPEEVTQSAVYMEDEDETYEHAGERYEHEAREHEHEEYEHEEDD